MRLAPTPWFGYWPESSVFVWSHAVDHRFVQEPFIEAVPDAVMAGTISSRTTAFSTASVWTKPMIRCRYQELDLAECHAVATAVCHCAAASAHCRQIGLRRLGTDLSQTPRRRKQDSNPRSRTDRRSLPGDLPLTLPRPKQPVVFEVRGPADQRAPS